MKAGWHSVRLGDVCEVFTGPFGSLLHKSDYVSAGTPLINPVNISDGKIVVGSEKTVNQKTLNRLRAYALSEGDIVVGRRGEIGRCAVIERDQAGWLCGTGCFFIKRSANVDPRFLSELIGAPLYRQRLERAATGTTMKNLSNQALQNLSIALPQQKAIVAILDEAFAELATATANAEKNLRNARDLFDSCVSSIFREDHDWEEVTLGEVAEFKNGLNFNKRSKGQEISIVGVRNFQNNLWVPLDDLDRVRIDGELNDAYVLRRGDILTVRSNGNKQLIGRCILAPEISSKTSHSGFTIRIRITRPDIDPHYLVRYLKSAEARKSLVESGDGAQISNLNQQALTSLSVKLLKPKEQRDVVARLEGIEAEANRLELFYEQRISQLAELRQSILQIAFSGRLNSLPSEAIEEAAE